VNIDAKYLPPMASGTNLTVRPERRATVCAASRISAVLVQPENLFQATVGIPVDVRAAIVDDCGQQPLSASAIVTFSTGEPAIALTPWRDGTWRSIWQPSAESGLVSARLAAAAPGVQNIARTIISGTIAPSSSIPIVLQDALSNTASQI